MVVTNQIATMLQYIVGNVGYFNYRALLIIVGMLTQR